MNNKKNILDQAVEAFSKSTIPAGPSDDLVRQTLDRIENEQSTIPFMERIGKMKSISKFAAAAIIIIGVLGIFLFNPTTSGVALADVYAKVQQAQAFVYEMSMTMSGMDKMMGMPGAGGSMDMEMTVVISEDYGMKMENHMQVPGPNGQTQKMTQLAYLLPEEKTMISIMPEQKMYQRIEFTDNLLDQTKKQNNDPREMIKQMLDCEYTELEQTEIDGITVQGFQTTDPAYLMGVGEAVKATLWVDVETWMPVKAEIWAKISGMEMTYVIDGFQWNVPITAADFEYVIPEDYKDQGSMKMPEMNEKAAIEGLQTYAKFFGEYPEKIDMASIIPSLVKKVSEIEKDPKTEYAKAFFEKMEAVEAAEGIQAAAQKSQQEFMPISGLAMFHMKLMQDKKNVAYYGDQVSPADTDSVLMRWKDEGDTYKVIFGDLSVAEMEHEDLAQIEPDNAQDDESFAEDLAESAGRAILMQTRLESAQRIKKLLLACIQYAQDNDGQWPEQLEDLPDGAIESQALINPAYPDNPNGYTYIRPARDLPIAETIVIYETYEGWNQGVNAGFADGHVEFIEDEAEFIERISH